jgi:hypothetical protein
VTDSALTPAGTDEGGGVDDGGGVEDGGGVDDETGTLHVPRSCQPVDN